MGKLCLSICVMALAIHCAGAIAAPMMPEQSAGQSSVQQSEGALDQLFGLAARTDRIADACCKHCSKGKACGDSCISRDKSCRKGAGCACD